MPNARGHFFGAISFHILFIFLFAKHWTASALLSMFFYGLPFAILGGLFPDVDINSWARKLLYFLTICTISFAVTINSTQIAITAVLFFVMAHVSKHRGVTHNPLFVIIFPALMANTILNAYFGAININKLAYFCFCNGALSHIFLDHLQTKTKRWFGCWKKKHR